MRYIKGCIGWSRPMIKANTLEPFIEVDNALNKLKMDDLVQEILDDVGEYLILRGYITKADKD